MNTLELDIHSCVKQLATFMSKHLRINEICENNEQKDATPGSLYDYLTFPKYGSYGRLDFFHDFTDKIISPTILKPK